MTHGALGTQRPLPPHGDMGTHQAPHGDVGPPGNPAGTRARCRHAGPSSWKPGTRRAPHSHGCVFSPTPALPLLPERVLRKPALGSLARTAAFPVAASLDPLGTETTRATGTINFIGLYCRQWGCPHPRSLWWAEACPAAPASCRPAENSLLAGCKCYSCNRYPPTS